MTRFQYFQSITSTEYEEKCAFPTYKIKGAPYEKFAWQSAWDRCAFDRQFGHFHKICRQVEQSGHVAYISLDNWIEYLDPFRKFFRENPHLQDTRALTFIEGKPIIVRKKGTGR